MTKPDKYKDSNGPVPLFKAPDQSKQSELGIRLRVYIPQSAWTCPLHTAKWVLLHHPCFHTPFQTAFGTLLYFSVASEFQPDLVSSQ